MSGRDRHGPRPTRLPSPLAQAVLVVIGAVALVLLVLQLAVPRPHDFSASLVPSSSMATSRK